MDDYEIKRMSASTDEIEEVKKLLHLTFPNRVNKFTYEYLKWQYADNPRGQVLSFNAYAKNGELAAHYATIPIEMSIDGKRIPGLLSLNTATHPNHRGKRLFTILAQQTYDKGKDLGYKYVIGVANANSTHGFLKNLGFSLIAPLEVKAGLGDPFNHSIPKSKHIIFYDEDFLKWRLRCPHFTYSAKGNTIYGSIDKPLFHSAVARIPDGMTLDQLELKKESYVFRLYIGLGLKPSGIYFNIPKFIKRSPFNLIFKDMSDGELPMMTDENIFFQLLDFDVA